MLYRPFYYTAVSDYAAKVFGFQTFGKVYGLIICLAGVGNFAQAGLDAVTLKGFNGDPVPVNAVLTGLVGVVGVCLVGYVSWKTVVLRGDKSAGTGVVGEDTVEASRSQSQSQSQSGIQGVTVRDWERQPLLSGGVVGDTQGQRGYGS